MILAGLVGGALVGMPTALLAQQWPPPPPPAKSTDRLPRKQQPEIEELTPRQIQRAQEPEPAPAAPAPVQAAPKPAPKVAKHTASAPPRAVACNGNFGKDSSHIKLATAYNSTNVAFTDVDGPDGTKVMASVLFPKDPKRRLEVWWQNEAARSGTYLIVINGQ
jgi:hypothetical protein